MIKHHTTTKHTNKHTNKYKNKHKIQTLRKNNHQNTLKHHIPNPKLIIGCHASIQPSVLDGIKWGNSINANAIQIFLGSNQSASLKTKTKLTPEDITNIKKYLQQTKTTLIIHSIYLLNFCKAPPTSGRVKYMHENIQHDLHIGHQINAKCVVLHLGFKLDLDPTTAMHNLTQNINHIITHMPPKIQLVLETSAGKGSEMGYTLDELTTIWNAIKHHGTHKIGICIDTAHIFVSGYNISNPTDCKKYLAEFNQKIGIRNIALIHLNDSRYPTGSRKDEHRGIGHGLIFNTPTGKQALKYLLKTAMQHQIPIILETHSAGSPDQHLQHGYPYEIEYLRKLI
jgi:deoxyribonuclease-4